MYQVPSATIAARKFKCVPSVTYQGSLWKAPNLSVLTLDQRDSHSSRGGDNPLKGWDKQYYCFYCFPAA